MPRERDWEPVPQVRVHSDHSPNSVTSQWMGQGPSEQAWDSLRPGQSTPPCAAETVTVRERVCTPELQVLEHEDHSEKKETLQFTGHSWVLQSRVSAREGHT